MAVLYRDYRPLKFSEVIGQEHIKATLQNAIASGNFSHAYLFTGTRGTGKTSVARILARAVNCPNQKDGEPCNKCEICRQFLDGKALDLVEIDAASNTGVENIREIIEHLKFSPSQAKYKVFIIDEVHMLSKGAFNALLKTLEEPPKHALFVLATTEVHKVPPTVISRTQRFDFKRIDNKKLQDQLEMVAKKEKIEIDKPSLQLVVNAAEGSLRDGLSILDKLSSFGKIDLEQAEKLLGITNVLAAQKLLDLLAASDASGAMNFLEETFASGVDPVQFNKDFLEYLRKVLMHAIGANTNFVLDQSQMENLHRHAKEIKTSQLLYIIRLFLRANKDFETAPSLELPVEIAAAEACLAQGNIGPAEKPKTAPAASADPVKKNSEKVEKAATKELIVEEELFEQPASKKPKIAVSLDQLLSAWPQILQKLRQANSSIMAVMQSVKIKSIEDNRIILSFVYKFHKDSLDNLKNKKILLNILSEHFNTDFEVKIVQEKTEDAKSGDSSDLALEVFGGEVI